MDDKPVTKEDLDKLAFDLTAQFGEAIARLQDRILELQASPVLTLDNALREQHGVSLTQALKDLIKTRGLDVTLPD